MILRTYRHKKLYQYLNLDKVVVNTVVKKGLLMYEFMSFTENRKQIKNYFIMREKKKSRLSRSKHVVKISVVASVQTIMSGWRTHMEIFVDDPDRRVHRTTRCTCSRRETAVGHISVVTTMSSSFLEIPFTAVHDVEGVVSLYVVDHVLLCGCQMGLVWIHARNHNILRMLLVYCSWACVGYEFMVVRRVVSNRDYPASPVIFLCNGGVNLVGKITVA